MSTKQDLADITARVIKDAAHDRRLAHERVNELRLDLDSLQEEVNKAFQPLHKEYQEAEAEVRAHARYKTHLPRKEWDAKQRELQKALDEASDKRTACEADGRRRAAPLQKRLDEAAKKAQELDVEWRVHERTAKAAGIDVDALLEEDDA